MGDLSFLLYLATFFFFVCFTSVWAYGYLFYTQSYNPVLQYLFCCSNYFICGHWELLYVRYCVPLTCLTSVLFVFCFFKHFLALQDAPGSSCVFPNLGIIHFSISSSFQGRMIFRNRDLGTECADCFQTFTAYRARK